jgi:hypothetical protein
MSSQNYCATAGHCLKANTCAKAVPVKSGSVKSGSDEPLDEPLDKPLAKACAKECCNAKPTPENKYCRKHQLQIFIDETADLGKRVCKNVIRGCKAQLDPEYEFVRCIPCYKREQDRDSARKAKKLEEIGEDEDPKTKLCKSCNKTQPLDEFVGTKNKGFVKSCKTCRETWKRNDANRDREHRNALAREAEKKPERIAVKKAWEAANPDKVEQKCKKSRAKRAAKDIDGYLQHNANVMKNWRDRNPEKIIESNRKRRESLEAHYKTYQRSARLKKLEFELSEEEFKALVTQHCYYCNIVDEKTRVEFCIDAEEPKSAPSDSVSKNQVNAAAFNGIDRMNQSIGYIKSNLSISGLTTERSQVGNCVSCCAMCNWLKGSLDSATFIKRARHIHSFQKDAYKQIHPECFPDAKCVSYASYRSRAEKKGLEFAITHDDYKSIIQMDCYLCGKKTTDANTNGIDRVDNAVGYVSENCKACCKECQGFTKSGGLSQSAIYQEKRRRVKDLRSLEDVVNPQFSGESLKETHMKISEGDSYENNHMKNNFELEVLLSKLERIQEHWKDRELPVLPTQIHSIVQLVEKRTKEELNREKCERKQRALQKHRDYLASIVK